MRKISPDWQRTMTESAQILLYGVDFPLRESRKQILMDADCKVYTADNLEHLSRLLQTAKVDLCVLCCSTSVEDCRKVLAMVAELSPEIHVLSLHPDIQVDFPEKHTAGSDMFIYPEALIGAVSRLLNPDTGQPFE
jgi:hypothetical protein